jgi:hypothetical protein
MELLDTKHVDVVVEAGIVKLKLDLGLVDGQINLPLVEILKVLAKKTDNKIDDGMVEMIEKALKV